jgi:hypothetical protein
MRLGIVVLPFEHLAVAVDRLLESPQLRQRHAAIEPSGGIVGRRGDCALVGRDRLGVTAELDEHHAAVEMRHRMLRRERQRRIEIGERALKRSKRFLGETAVQPRLEMLRVVGEHGLQFGERLAVAVERDQRVGVLIKNADVVGRQRARSIETLQRLSRPLERMLGLAEIAPAVRDVRIGLDRRSEQALRLAELTLLNLDGAEEIERVEMIGRGFEDARIEPLRLAQPALPVQRHRLAERLTQVERRGACFHRLFTT